MTRRVLDLTGEKFGKLTAKTVGRRDNKRAWNCDCDCGGTIIVTTFELTSGNIIRCKDCHTTNLIGARSGNLTVIEKLGRTKCRQQYWLCQCDCGNTHKVLSRNIQRQSSTHCGCKTSEIMSGNRTLPNNLGGWNSLYSDYKHNARTRNLEFTISKDELFSFCQENCYYCGDAPKRQLRLFNSEEKVYYNGIDRKDNSLGYSLSNCVTCCTTCNFMKREISYTDFISHIAKIANRLKEIKE